MNKEIYIKHSLDFQKYIYSHFYFYLYFYSEEKFDLIFLYYFLNKIIGNRLN